MQVPIIAYASITGINENQAIVNSIYPNPVNDEINFISPLHNATITLFDVNGKQILSNTSFSGTTLTGLSKYPKGSYFISVTENKTTSTHSFIKN